MKRKDRKIWFIVETKNNKYRKFAKTKEGAVKQVFGDKMPSMPVQGGWQGVNVYPEDGYTRIYKL